MLLRCEYVYVVLSFRYPCIYFFFFLYMYTYVVALAASSQRTWSFLYIVSAASSPFDRALFHCLFLQTQTEDFPYNHPFRDLPKSNPEPKLASGNAHTLPPPPNARPVLFPRVCPPHAQEQKRAATIMSSLHLLENLSATKSRK